MHPHLLPKSRSNTDISDDGCGPPGWWGWTTHGEGMLEKATGKQFDEAFLTGMLAHHRGAVEMAKTQLMDGSDAAAKELAQAVVTGQSKEITEIQGLLAQLKG